jgi:mercuric ion binding protein
MRKVLIALSVSIILLTKFAVAVAGELKTITLEVDKMTCNLCPITVKKALRKIDGVTEVVAKYEGEGNGWAKVTFDPSKADVDDLTFATEEAGYPSRLKP